MAKGTKVCKICGKEYEYCMTPYKPEEGNRWQDVGCCVEHAQQYFAAVLASRLHTETNDTTPVEEGGAEEVSEPPRKSARKKKETGDD